MLENKYPLICRNHGFDEVPEHLIPDCPICNTRMVKYEDDAVYQIDFELLDAYYEAGFDLDRDVFSYAHDIYICAKCEAVDCDNALTKTITEIRWYYIYGDSYQPLVPIHPSEYDRIQSLIQQQQQLQAGQAVMQGFPSPDFSELDNIVVDPK
ncbi:MAG: hypothetical protein AAFV93_24910 [Chloroflexota bacterium]